MKRGIWFVLAAVAAVAVGVALVALPRGAEWSCASPAAASELAAGVEAMQKLYGDEARVHFERVLELDPGCAVAKLFLVDAVRMSDSKRAEKLMDELEAVDRARLNPRERLLIDRMAAVRAERYEEAERLVDAYLDRHPDDPFVLHMKATTAWSMGDDETAKELNERLIEIAPNWVLAYNQLGYIAMKQGRFAAAEEYFKSYRFVAPDQANPHDSLGELYTVLGRYDEALASFEEALRIKPEFWASYEHLLLVHSLRGDAESAEQVVARAEAVEGVTESLLLSLRCRAAVAAMVRGEQWARLLTEVDPECIKGWSGGYTTLSVHLAACRLGRWSAAGAIEEGVEAKLAEAGEGKVKGAFAALGEHIAATRAAFEGRFDEAVAGFTRADQQLDYLESSGAVFKLHNRLCLAETLRAAGRTAEAEAMVAEVRAVNPAMADAFEAAGGRALGL